MEQSGSIAANNLSHRSVAGLFEWQFLERANPAVLIGLPVMVLLTLCLPHIATGYWVDEIYSVTESKSFSGMFRIFRNYETNMALYQVILCGWMRVFGDSEIATHALSLLAAVITLPVFFALERIWMNKTSSFFGVLLLSVSPLFTFNAVETRSYSMLILSVTLSSLLFMRLLRKPAYNTAIWYGLSVGVGAYIHYFALLIPMVHAFALTRKTLTKKYLVIWLVAGAVAACIILPLVLFPPLNKTQVDWIVAPDGKKLWYVFSALFGGGYTLVILAVCLFFVFRGRYWKRGTEEDYIPEKFSVAWAFIPVLLMFVFSIWVKPVFVTRFFSWITPGAALFIIIVIGYTSNKRNLQTALFILLVCIFAIKSVLFFRTKGSGFKDTAYYLSQQVKTGETVLIYPYFWSLDINYYLGKNQSTTPAARPVSITRFSYLGGGGGRDPDPALDIVDSVADKKGKIYLICNGYPELSRGDSIQKRIWLAPIRKMLTEKHQTPREMIFGEETQNPVRLLIFN
jgi:mannosyltransferase